MGFLAPVLSIGGAIAGALGGGDKPQQNSSAQGNKAFDQLNTAYTPQTKTGLGANNFMAGLLGVPGGDTAGSDAGFADYLAKAGYAPALETMQRGVVGGQAARGLLNSGSTSRRLLQEGAKIDQGFYNNYFQNLNTLSGRGLEAGQLIGNSGQYGTSQGTGAQPGILTRIGSGLKGGAEIADGLGPIFKNIFA